ncbi:dephospho-CoA kinase [Actinosynnema pretiosum]|uniref:Dephospho-CoA kinase n=1 Tax=Actinosynnema pretiosum TaxID=42197 RepID=A0A290ZC63_9PSEU|nr:dephospho-CoA kinase [Actinosynnema pretiosum]ATE56563.1 dephospho-CoA kinase [Actinosynnema pretiosum]
MLRVGLSGGIGSGKSTVAGRLAEHGAVVIDADQLARRVVEPGTDGLREIAEAFGASVLTPAGRLDRAALAGQVFADDTARARLNAIVHPKVAALTAELIASAPEDSIVVHDVPLLVENGLAPAYHLVVITHADVEQRVARLVGSRDMPESDARARVAAQAGDDARRAVADVWLDNTGSPDQVLAEVDALWADRLVPYAANLRLRRHASGPPKVVDPDPTWPAQAARIAARLRTAVGDRPLEHIGSTAVPGLVAKDVLDFQLGVSSMAEADGLADALLNAGFPNVPGLTDAPRGAERDPELWDKRVHSSADPGRRVNLHVRVTGAPNWVWALRFRDWLRADAAAREEYARVKLGLVPEHENHHGSLAYAQAKEPWMEEAVSRIAAFYRAAGDQRS